MMKHLKLAVALLVTLLCSTLASCDLFSNEYKDIQPKSYEERLPELLYGHYDVQSIFNQNSMHVNILDTKYISADDQAYSYFYVDSERYQTVGTLTDMLNSIYYNPELIADYLGTHDKRDQPLFVDIDGELYMSTAPVAAVEIYFPQIETARKVTEEGDNITVQATAESISGNKVTLQYQLLAAHGSYFISELPKIIEYFDGDTLISSTNQPSFQLLAEGFLNQLNTNALYLKDATGNDVAFTNYGTVTTEIIETIATNDYCHEFKVMVSATGGNGFFPSTPTEYTLRIQDVNGVRDVDYFRPSSEQPFNYNRLTTGVDLELRDIPTMQVYDFINLFGVQIFGSVSAIPDYILMEYSLYQLSLEYPQRMVFTYEEVEAMSLSYFNRRLPNNLTETEYYNEAQDGYILPGSGFKTGNALVYYYSTWQNFQHIQVRTFKDTYRMIVDTQTTFALRSNDDERNTYEFQNSWYS